MTPPGPGHEAAEALGTSSRSCEIAAAVGGLAAILTDRATPTAINFA
jgi:hypothetical protein